MIDRYPNFLPEWTKAIEHYYRENSPSKDSYDIINFVVREYDLDWYSASCCLTGEAFFHKENTDCGTCDLFTYSCGRVFGSLTKLYTFKLELAKHLQEDHPDIWKQWKDIL